METEESVTWNKLKGNFNEAAPEIAREFNKLSTDEVLATNGDRAQLEQHLSSRYGYSKEEAQQHLDQIAAKLTRDPEGGVSAR